MDRRRFIGRLAAALGAGSAFVAARSAPVLRKVWHRCTQCGLTELQEVTTRAYVRENRICSSCDLVMEHIHDEHYLRKQQEIMDRIERSRISATERVITQSYDILGSD